MKFNDPIDNETEATMSSAIISDTATQRYGYAPQVMFAATRAGAERRRARETAAVTASHTRASRSALGLIRRLATHLMAS